MRKTLFTIKLFTIKENGLTFAIKVSPKAKKNCISDVVTDQNNQPILKIYTTAPPEDGKANKAIINLLSKIWGLRKNQIKIIMKNPLNYNFLKIYSDPTISNTIPNEVMRLVINKDMSRIRAWREYLKITQKEVANKIGISQAALSQIEVPNSKIRRITLEKIAKALGLTIEQLR